MCKVFGINENLFLKSSNINQQPTNNENKKPNLNLNNNSRSDSIDSNSMNSLKQSAHENTSNEEAATLMNGDNKCKYSKINHFE